MINWNISYELLFGQIFLCVCVSMCVDECVCVYTHMKCVISIHFIFHWEFWLKFSDSMHFGSPINLVNLPLTTSKDKSRTIILTRKTLYRIIAMTTPSMQIGLLKSSLTVFKYHVFKIRVTTPLGIVLKLFFMIHRGRRGGWIWYLFNQGLLYMQSSQRWIG